MSPRVSACAIVYKMRGDDEMIHHDDYLSLNKLIDLTDINQLFLFMSNKFSIPSILLRRSSRIVSTAPERAEPSTCPSKRLVGETVSKKSKKIKKEPDDIVDIKVETCDKSALISPPPIPDGYISADPEELDLERTLLGGQSFRWVKHRANGSGSAKDIFTGVISNHVLRIWRESDDRIAFKKLNIGNDEKISDLKAQLEDYFQLKYSLKDLYREWSNKDQHLAKCCEQYKGFRILRQNPTENVFSFICATNNNIKRISQMIEKLCNKFGNKLIDEIESENGSFHSFPTIKRLAQDDVFQCLRYELGFGYRAKFIHESAKFIMKLNEETPDNYLMSLRDLKYEETREKLTKLPGIGRKVADCICLMSMDHLKSVPCDCHIYEIVCRTYMPNLRSERKTLTDSVHDMIGKYFNDLHGPLAGWSTSVLFIAELKHLKMAEEKGKKVSATKLNKQ